MTNSRFGPNSPASPSLTPQAAFAVDDLAVATIRTLAIDSVERANSGHPGLPMGAAPMAYVLWSRFMSHNPAQPSWPNRDRFVLSAGHGSTLLYSLLHLMNYDVSLDDLKRFRQWGSKTPGHPERGHTPGVETTTGPLGQGFANAVGMAMTERFLTARYNREGFPVVDHRTFVLAGDGDLMEGVSYEAASLAGHLGLDKLVVLYDSNDISLDGPTERSFTESVAARFEAANWFVLRVEDGNDLTQIDAAIRRALEHRGKPTLIEVRTIIGFGSPGRQGTSAAHGMPLGKEETRLAKQAYQWTFDEDHTVPVSVREHFSQLAAAGKARADQWNELLERYRAQFPDVAAELELALSGSLPPQWDADLPVYTPGQGEYATRQASGQAINALARAIPNFLGGSADLASSNETMMKGEPAYGIDNYNGRNIWFGVREHAMGAILNGMAAHGGVHVYGGTFLVFSDYLRPSIRLAALMKLPVIYVFTHDSIGVGEDGPTHQPVEHVAALRIIPNLVTIRPADANETVAAWRFAMTHRDRPVALALTRQKLPVLPDTHLHATEGVARGGYVAVAESRSHIDAILIATGSEVSLAHRAQLILEEEGLSVRLVSLPSFRLFDEQDETYRHSVLPPHVRVRVGVEMLHSFGWERYVGAYGEVVAIDHFGASAPGGELMKQFGFTEDAIVSAVQRSQKRSGQQ